MDERLKNLQKQINHCENIISEQLANYKLQKETIDKYELENIKLQETASKSMNAINVMLKTFDLINTNVDLQILEINNKVKPGSIKIDRLQSIKNNINDYLNKLPEQIINQETNFDNTSSININNSPYSTRNKKVNSSTNFERLNQNDQNGVCQSTKTINQHTLPTKSSQMKPTTRNNNKMLEFYYQKKKSAVKTLRESLL